MGLMKRTVEQIQLDILKQEKECCVCNIRKAFTDFYNYKNKSDGKSYRCKPCDDLARQAWRRKNPERSYDSLRNRQLKYKYGITLTEYQVLLEKQGHSCAICGTKEGGHMNSSTCPSNFAVDHCHTTGGVRGLLCNTCNRALGLFKDSKEVLTKAIKYLTLT